MGGWVGGWEGTLAGFCFLAPLLGGLELVDLGLDNAFVEPLLEGGAGGEEGPFTRAVVLELCWVRWVWVGGWVGVGFGFGVRWVAGGEEDAEERRARSRAPWSWSFVLWVGGWVGWLGCAWGWGWGGVGRRNLVFGAEADVALGACLAAAWDGHNFLFLFAWWLGLVHLWAGWMYNSIPQVRVVV